MFNESFPDVCVVLVESIPGFFHVITLKNCPDLPALRDLAFLGVAEAVAKLASCKGFGLGLRKNVVRSIGVCIDFLVRPFVNIGPCSIE